MSKETMEQEKALVATFLDFCEATVSATDRQRNYVIEEIRRERKRDVLKRNELNARCPTNK